MHLDPHPNPEPHAPTIQQRVYLWLAAVFVSSLLLADILGVKLFRIPLGFSFTLPIAGKTIDAIEHTCGMLTFPVTFLLTDLINEYYGKRAARRVTYLGFAMGLFAFVVINAAQAMPYLEAPFNVGKPSFDSIFGSAKVMYIASLCAYMAGQLCDIFLFGVLKRWTGGRMVWLRATGSTLASQLLDSFVVSYLAFSLGRQVFPDPANPPAPASAIPAIAVTGYLLKFCIALALTPMIYAGRAAMRRWFGLTPIPPESA